MLVTEHETHNDNNNVLWSDNCFPWEIRHIDG